MNKTPDIDVNLLKNIRSYLFNNCAGIDSKAIGLVDALDAILPKNPVVDKMPGVGVGVFLVRPPHTYSKTSTFDVLLLHRINKEGFGNNEWSLPGGKVDWMENPVDTAIRETWEETRQVIKNPEFVGITNDVWPILNKHFVTIYYVAQASTDDHFLAEPDKCDNSEWIPFNSLKSIPNLFTGIANIVDTAYWKHPSTSVFDKYIKREEDKAY